MKKRKFFKLKKSDPITKQTKNDEEIQSDVLGSYTGVPDVYDMIPEQDPDDL